LIAIKGRSADSPDVRALVLRKRDHFCYGSLSTALIVADSLPPTKSIP